MVSLFCIIEKKEGVTMLAILSPAKTFSMVEEGRLKSYKPLQFHEQTLELMRILQSYSQEELAKLMKMSLDLAKVNEQRNHTFEDTSVMQAYEAILYFYGEAYKGLDAQSLGQEELLYLNDHVRILSGLYGVIRPLECIKPYRLEMGTKLSNPKGKDLYKYWKEHLTKYFLQLLSETSGDKALIQLASEEYSKVLDLKVIQKHYPVIEISFKDYKNGQYKVVGMYAKKARGQMIRYITTKQIDQIDELKAFGEDGYRFNEILSTQNHFIFTRE